MQYIKTAVWILILSVLYADGIFSLSGVYPGLLFVFSLTFCLFCESLKKKTAVLLICGLLSNALGGRTFVFSILSFVYAGLLFDVIFTGKTKRFLSPLAFFIITLICEMAFCLIYKNVQIKTALISALINSVFFIMMYPLIKRTYVKKERYIF